VRVAIFTDNDFGKVNGVTTTLSAVLKHAPASCAMRVYTADDEGVERPDYLSLASFGIPIPFYGEMKMYLPRLAEYRDRLIEDRADLVHLTTPGPVGLVGMRLARELGLPLVGTFHTDLAAYAHLLSGWRVLGALMQQFMRWPYGRCARVLVPSEATRNLLLESGGDPERVVIWSRGVDTDAFTPARRSEALRRSWRVSATRPAILYVGRISKEKGLDLLPDLARQLQVRGVPHRLVLAGGGPLLPTLRRQLPDAIFTGSLDRETVATVFASSDIFLFPSRTDTAGNVVLEAQASGLPVLVSGAGGPREHMVDRRTGVVIAEQNGSAWVDALEALLRDEARRTRMAGEARQYAVSRSWESALEPLYRTYRDVLVAHSRQAVARLTPAREPAP
jgi:glycosyltransferase involved in cell wall biosynthesis